MLARGQHLLLPVNPWFILGSLFVALMLTLVPLGHLPWMPQIWLLVLLFWCLHEPNYVGITVLFFGGLIADVNDTTILGVHALAYSVGGCMMLLGRRRLMLFPALQQLPMVFGVLLVVNALIWVFRLLGNGIWPGWQLLGAPILEACLWPLLSWILLAPQRRVPDRDLTRPL